MLGLAFGLRLGLGLRLRLRVRVRISVSIRVPLGLGLGLGPDMDLISETASPDSKIDKYVSDHRLRLELGVALCDVGVK